MTLTFKAIVNTGDTGGEVIPNFAVFTNVGTSGCTAATCDTNTVSVTVATAPVTSPAVTTPPTTPPTPTPPPTAPLPVTSPPTAPPPVTSPSTIAFTGAYLSLMAATALAFMGLGGGLLILSRRRGQQARQARHAC